GVVHAGDDLDQRRLAGTVVADDRVHLVRPEREAPVAQRDHTAEPLLDRPGLEERSPLHVRTTSLSSASASMSARYRACQTSGPSARPSRGTSPRRSDELRAASLRER